MLIAKSGDYALIHCCGCSKVVEARLTNGEEIYPHRRDLYGLPFWRCDDCGNYVGCHHKTKQRTKPMGSIPTPEIKEIRGMVHGIIDPVWRGGLKSRREVYRAMSEGLGYEYHTASISSADEGRRAMDIASQLFYALELA